jgi:hypothetical protein
MVDPDFLFTGFSIPRPLRTAAVHPTIWLKFHFLVAQYVNTESTDGFKFEGVKKNQALGTQHTPGSSKTVSNKV